MKLFTDHSLILFQKCDPYNLHLHFFGNIVSAFAPCMNFCLLRMSGHREDSFYINQICDFFSLPA